MKVVVAIKSDPRKEWSESSETIGLFTSRFSEFCEIKTIAKAGNGVKTFRVVKKNLQGFPLEKIIEKKSRV